MNIKLGYLIAYFLLFSSGVIANEANYNGDPKTNIVKNYDVLKEKTDRGETVRVIAKIKYVQIENPGSTPLPPEFVDALNLLENLGIKAIREMPQLGILVFRVDGQALTSIINSGIFERIEEDIRMKLNLSKSTEQINAVQARAEGFKGSGQAIVIMDTGVDVDHPFFSKRVVEQACFSTNSDIDGATSLCPNGEVLQIGSNAARPCDIPGVCDHGTHVAGIAAGDNGVAPGANIIAIQVFSKFPPEECPDNRACLESYHGDMLSAMNWLLNESTTENIVAVKTENIAAVNMSLGGGKETSACDHDSLAYAINKLRNKNIATVIASGNGGWSDGVSFPACISSAITVGSSYTSANTGNEFVYRSFRSDGEAVGSNVSSLVDILAPGYDIESSIFDGRYGKKTGTSMAAPHVAGAFAVMRQAHPNASVSEIEASLEANGKLITDAAESGLTFPRLDLYEALKRPIASLDKDSYSVMVNKETEFTARPPGSRENSTVTYSWSFGDDVAVETKTAKTQHTYTSTGTYNLDLSVKYVDGDDSIISSNPNDMASVTVYDPTIISIIVSSLLL